MARRFVAWAFVGEAIPIYPVYTLLFVDAGLSDGQISALLAIWSAVGIAAEVPMGALADRWSHRNALVAGALLQALGYVAWIAAPGFTGFAIGFVVWALGGALVSGSSEALLYEGLTAAGAADHYARVQGWATAAEFLAFIPAVLVATALLPIGGYAAIGWVSVATCLAAAVLAARLPPAPATADPGEDGTSTLRAGLREAIRPTVAGTVVALAVIGGFDAIEEYFPLLAQDWGVPTGWVPLAVLGGDAGRRARRRPWRTVRRHQSLRCCAADRRGGDGAGRRRARRCGGWPLALAAFYLLHHLVLVVLDARLQAGSKVGPGDDHVGRRTRDGGGRTCTVRRLGGRSPGAGDGAVVGRGGDSAVVARASAPFGHDRGRRRTDERSDEAGLVRGRG